MPNQQAKAVDTSTPMPAPKVLMFPKGWQDLHRQSAPDVPAEIAVLKTLMVLLALAAARAGRLCCCNAAHGVRWRASARRCCHADLPARHAQRLPLTLL